MDLVFWGLSGNPSKSTVIFYHPNSSKRIRVLRKWWEQVGNGEERMSDPRGYKTCTVYCMCTYTACTRLTPSCQHHFCWRFTTLKKKKKHCVHSLRPWMQTRTFGLRFDQSLAVAPLPSSLQTDLCTNVQSEFGRRGIAKKPAEADLWRQLQ